MFLHVGAGVPGYADQQESFKTAREVPWPGEEEEEPEQEQPGPQPAPRRTAGEPWLPERHPEWPGECQKALSCLPALHVISASPSVLERCTADSAPPGVAGGGATSLRCLPA